MYQIIVNFPEDKEKKEIETQLKIEQYKDEQLYQLEHGGPGPVSDYEVMTIVNEHNSEFEVVVQKIVIEEAE